MALIAGAVSTVNVDLAIDDIKAVILATFTNSSVISDTGSSSSREVRIQLDPDFNHVIRIYAGSTASFGIFILSISGTVNLLNSSANYSGMTYKAIKYGNLFALFINNNAVAIQTIAGTEKVFFMGTMGGAFRRVSKTTDDMVYEATFIYTNQFDDGSELILPHYATKDIHTNFLPDVVEGTRIFNNANNIGTGTQVEIGSNKYVACKQASSSSVVKMLVQYE